MSSHKNISWNNLNSERERKHRNLLDKKTLVRSKLTCITGPNKKEPNQAGQNSMNLGGLKKSLIHKSLEDLHSPKNFRQFPRTSTDHSGMKGEGDPSVPEDFQNQGDHSESDDQNVPSSVKRKPRSCQIQLKEKQNDIRKLRVASAILFHVFRSKRLENQDLMTTLIEKKYECASRKILCGLIRNSWKKSQKRAIQIGEELNEANNKVENLCLQLRVLRHVFTNEKKKNQELENNLKSKTTELTHNYEEKDRNIIDLERLEKELNSMEDKLDEFRTENFKLKSKLKLSEEKEDNMNRILSLQSYQVKKLEKSNKELKENIEKLNKKLEDLTTSCNNWQEKARTQESDAWKYRLDYEVKCKELSNKDTEIQTLKNGFDDLNLAKMNADEQIRDGERKVQNYNLKLAKINKHVEEIKKSHEQESLKLNDLREENRILKAEIYRFKSDRTRALLSRRRFWISIVGFIFDPRGTFRVLYYGDNRFPKL